MFTATSESSVVLCGMHGTPVGCRVEFGIDGDNLLGKV
jgi:hypothetical protein